MSERQGDMSYKGFVGEVKYSEEDGKFIKTGIKPLALAMGI